MPWWLVQPWRDISIHAPRAGRDTTTAPPKLGTPAFQSTRPVRGATRPLDDLLDRDAISIHAPRAGRDWPCSQALTVVSISIHAPRAGRDRCGANAAVCVGISIHAPRAGRDGTSSKTRGRGNISIHAPRAGRDLRMAVSRPQQVRFQSTRPVRGATVPLLQVVTSGGDFNPRAPCGARLMAGHRVMTPEIFQSTRPVRGATEKAEKQIHAGLISIHAPRAGRDSQVLRSALSRCDFNPRAPCGARP